MGLIYYGTEEILTDAEVKCKGDRNSMLAIMALAILVEKVRL